MPDMAKDMNSKKCLLAPGNDEYLINPKTVIFSIRKMTTFFVFILTYKNQVVDRLTQSGHCLSLREQPWVSAHKKWLEHLSRTSVEIRSWNKPDSQILDLLLLQEPCTHQAMLFLESKSRKKHHKSSCPLDVTDLQIILVCALPMTLRGQMRLGCWARAEIVGPGRLQSQQ